MSEETGRSQVFELLPGDFRRCADRVRPGEYVAVGNWLWRRPPMQEFELYLLGGGSGRFRLGDHEYAATEGDLLLISPGTEVEVEKTGADNMVLRFCHFDFGLHGVGHIWQSWGALTHYLHHLASEGALAREGRLLLPAYLPLDPDPELLSAHDELMCLHSGRPWAGRAAVWGRLLLLLAELSRRFVARASALPAATDSTEERASRHVARAVRFVETHLGAEGLGLSDDHIGRLFREATGETVGAFILRRKVQTAKARLLSGNKSVKEIAAELGFSDARYFSRQFRKREGMSPAQFRSAQL
jgi:AraC-like DNA-binding protein